MNMFLLGVVVVVAVCTTNLLSISTITTTTTTTKKASAAPPSFSYYQVSAFTTTTPTYHTRYDSQDHSFHKHHHHQQQQTIQKSKRSFSSLPIISLPPPTTRIIQRNRRTIATATTTSRFMILNHENLFVTEQQRSVSTQRTLTKQTNNKNRITTTSTILFRSKQQQYNNIYPNNRDRSSFISSFLSSVSTSNNEESDDEEPIVDAEFVRNDNRNNNNVTTTTTILMVRNYVHRNILLAIHKFRSRPGTYLLIPCIAALVGWFTNWLAVQMIFYPINYWGFNWYRKPLLPLGFIGWQGIVPCKTIPMSQAIVDMVTTQLLSVSEAFYRLDPNYVATILSPEIPKIAQTILKESTTATISSSSSSRFLLWFGNKISNTRFFVTIVHSFLQQFTVVMQQNAQAIFSIDTCVIRQMILDRSKLGELFQTVATKELQFLTNSGLWFGFILGLIQMFIALFWNNPWSLSMYVSILQKRKQLKRKLCVRVCICSFFERGFFFFGEKPKEKNRLLDSRHHQNENKIGVMLL